MFTLDLATVLATALATALAATVVAALAAAGLGGPCRGGVTGRVWGIRRITGRTPAAGEQERRSTSEQDAERSGAVRAHCPMVRSGATGTNPASSAWAGLDPPTGQLRPGSSSLRALLPEDRRTMSLRAPLATDGGVNRTDAVAQLHALHALHAITRASSEASNDDDLLRWTASAAQRALRAASVSIARFERERAVLRTLVSVGDLGPTERELPEYETYAINEYATLEFLDSGGRGAVTTLKDPEAIPSELELLRILGKHSAVDVPIFLDGAVWGELYATRSADMEPFTYGDLEFAEAVAAQVAAGIAQGAHARRLEALARLDPLTGLANRSAVEERLDRAIDAYLLMGRNVSVAMCDVNALKPVNDELGHDAGDRLLTRTAELLSQAAARLPGSLAGRLGGDEFPLVVEDLSTDELLPVLRDLCQHARELPQGAGLSCGVASTSDPIGHVGTTGDLLRLADGAQYRAKRSDAYEPVVAGRSLAPDVAAALASGVAGSNVRSPRAGRRPSDAAHAMVAQVVALLDGKPRASALDRLATVGAAVVTATDAGAWWVSVVPAGADTMHSL